MKASHGGDDAAVGVGADDADGEAARAGGVFGAAAGADAGAVLVEGIVEDVVEGLDGPLAAVEGERAFGVGGERVEAGDAAREFDGALSGLLDDGGAFDEEGLADMGEGDVVVEFRGGPDGASLDAAVGESGRFAEVGLAAGAEDRARCRRAGWAGCSWR